MLCALQRLEASTLTFTGNLHTKTSVYCLTTTRIRTLQLQEENIPSKAEGKEKEHALKTCGYINLDKHKETQSFSSAHPIALQTHSQLKTGFSQTPTQAKQQTVICVWQGCGL